MMSHIISYSTLVLIFLIIRFSFSNLKSKFYKNHQKLAGKESIPLLGGIVIFCYYSYQISLNDYDFFLFSFLILLLGIFSDNNFLESPKLRLTFQSVILLLFLNSSNLQINDLRNDLLNEIISNYYFGIFFTTFCLLVLINGSNFIDGLDGLNLGYFFLIITIIIYLDEISIITVNQDQVITIFHIISFLLILNIFNLLYLGDSGSYLIAFIFGTFLVDLSDNNYFLSPYFIALLLWYPAFENLFSIIRKRLIKKDPFAPDNKHFHQLLFNYLKKYKNKFIYKFSNIISSILILLYNSVIFYLGTNYINHTKILLLLILINVILYLSLYSILKKNS